MSAGHALLQALGKGPDKGMLEECLLWPASSGREENRGRCAQGLPHARPLILSKAIGSQHQKVLCNIETFVF